MSDPTPEEQAEVLLESEGFTVAPPRAVVAEVPVAPPMQPTPALTPVGKASSLWKPRNQEFFETDFTDLCEQLAPTILVCYDLVDEAKDGVEGHTLICTVSN